MSLPVISFDQFKAASADLIEEIRSGVAKSQIPRTGVNISLTTGYVLQFVRDRVPTPSPEPPLPDPSNRQRAVFGQRGWDDDHDAMADMFHSIALEMNPDKYGPRMRSAPVEGPVIDWVVRQGLEALMELVLSQPSLAMFRDLIQFVIDQLQS